MVSNFLLWFLMTINHGSVEEREVEERDVTFASCIFSGGVVFLEWVWVYAGKKKNFGIGRRENKFGRKREHVINVKIWPNMSQLGSFEFIIYSIFLYFIIL